MGKELYSVNAGLSKRKGGMIGSVRVAVGGGVKEYICLRVAEAIELHQCVGFEQPVHL